MKILMFGWEFPPYKTGGLGTACHDLTKGLAKQNIQVTFVMPVAPTGAKTKFAKLISANNYSTHITLKCVDSLLLPYSTTETYQEMRAYTHNTYTAGKKEVYGKNLFAEVQRYAAVAGKIAAEEEHDIIHAHDWMTYGAAINAKKISHKPLIVHIHATEYDRTIGHPNKKIKDIEQEGFNNADIIIANSNFLKNTVMQKYNIPQSKIKVVHWGIDQELQEYELNYKTPLKEKIVLYLGRMAAMKGPDHFLQAAKQVLQFEPRTKFVMAGGGEMLPRIILLAAELGISSSIIFTGPLSGEQVHKAFQLADLFVMPSISEPFGLVALEALKNKTPVLISKQSGVSEVLNHALKADFWDQNEMVNKIVAVLRYKSLQQELTEKGTEEIKKFDIYTPAKKCIEIYTETQSKCCPQMVIA